jgi:hypothetical protein
MTSEYVAGNRADMSSTWPQTSVEQVEKASL